jgi:hypothetical protein
MGMYAHDCEHLIKAVARFLRLWAVTGAQMQVIIVMPITYPSWSVVF